jgi:hypothetical protein
MNIVFFSYRVSGFSGTQLLCEFCEFCVECRSYVVMIYGSLPVSC